jgi:hypothetical protein
MLLDPWEKQQARKVYNFLYRLVCMTIQPQFRHSASPRDLHLSRATKQFGGQRRGAERPGPLLHRRRVHSPVPKAQRRNRLRVVLKDPGARAPIPQRLAGQERAIADGSAPPRGGVATARGTLVGTAPPTDIGCPKKTTSSLLDDSSDNSILLKRKAPPPHDDNDDNSTHIRITRRTPPHLRDVRTLHDEATATRTNRDVHDDSVVRVGAHPTSGSGRKVNNRIALPSPLPAKHSLQRNAFVGYPPCGRNGHSASTPTLRVDVEW